MSDMSSMNRESKKQQLRKQIVPSPSDSARNSAEQESEEIVHKAHKKVRGRRLRILFMILIILCAAGVGIFVYLQRYQYTSYEVVWEKALSEGSFIGYESFNSNVMKYSRDGASYIDERGKEIWSLSYEMKSPITSVNGSYAVIADQQGNSIYIFDKSGNVGVATTLLPIIKVSVSARGVVAAILEDSASNYIYFYKQDGSELDVKIKALLNGNSGYPVDISLSPDGTQLVGSYAYLNNGTLGGRVAFHNFSEVGKNVPDRLVGGFDDSFDGSLVARVRFLDDTWSCAFANNSVSFFSTRNVLSPELVKQEVIQEEIRSVFFSDKYVGVIVSNEDGENPERMEIYKSNGDKVFSQPFHYQYTHADIDGERVILYNEDSCKIYNMSGRLKFDGSFDFSVAKIRNGKYPNTLLVMGAQNMKEIRLQ